MIHFSKAFRKSLWDGNRTFLVWADITLVDGTELHLTNEHIRAGGFSIDDAISEDSSFSALGSAIMGSAELEINNIDESFSSYDFTYAKVELYIGKYFEEEERTEKERKGVYTVDEATYGDGLIRLYCLDNMYLLDQPYQTSLVYPATLDSVVRDICSQFDIDLNTYEFPHRDYMVKKKPDGDRNTFRDVLAQVAMVAGCFARVDRFGRLELKWFDQETLAQSFEGYDGGSFDHSEDQYYQSGDTLDGGSFNPWNNDSDEDGGSFENEPMHYITALNSQEISVDDVVITGIVTKVTLDTDHGSETRYFTAGDEGYRIAVEDNSLIDVERAQEVTDWLGLQLIGLRFRKASVTHQADPAIEAGDIGYVFDRKGRQYPILITHTNFAAGKLQRTVSAAETPSRNSGTKYTAVAKAFEDARKLIRQEKTDREQALEGLAQRLADKAGLYTTVEAVEGGGFIYYLHDKEELSDSLMVWKMTADAFGVSTDGGQTWNAGLTVDGDMITRILNAVGVNANWINTGSLEIKKNNSTVFKADVDTGHLYIDAKNSEGTTTFKVNSNTGEVQILASSFTLTTSGGESQTIEEAVQGAGSASITKAGLVEKLGDGETNPGIYLQNNQLKIRADAIYTGVLKGRNGNTKWDLDTGELSMTKGSISLGGTTQVPYPEFSVSSSGHMEAVDAIFRNIYASGPSRDYVKIGTGIEGCFHVPPNNIQLKSRINFTCTDFTGTGQGGIVPSISFLSGAYEFWGDFDPESSSGIPRAVKVYFYTRNFTADASSFYINTDDLRINNYQGYSGTVWIGEHYLIFRHGILTSQGTF